MREESREKRVELRLWYAKTGRAKYISHLDLNRCFTRAVRRAELPLWYTEGFNPHPYLTFPLPLPLGQEALREPLDIRLTENVEPEQIREWLAAVLPEGIQIVDATRPVLPAKEIAAAACQIRLRLADECQAEAFRVAAQAVLDSGELMAEKKGKKGIETKNICPMIKRCEIVGRDVPGTPPISAAELQLSATLAAGNTANLNAALLVDALQASVHIRAESCAITRLGLLVATGEAFC